MIDDATFDERRQARRYPVRLPVTVFANGVTVEGVRGHTVDISSRGLRLVTDADLAHGDEQTVILDVPGEPIVAKADLVWTEVRGMQWVHGMLLVDIEPADEGRLGQLCVERV